MTTTMKRTEVERIVDTFKGISSSHGIDIRFAQADVCSVKIGAKAKLIEEIETYVESGILCIKWKNELTGFLKAKFLKRTAVTAYITAPILNKIELSTGTDLYADSIRSNGELSVSVANGSGLKAAIIDAQTISFFVKQASGVEIESVKALNVLIDNSSHSDVELNNINVENLPVKASGFSDTNLSAKVQHIAIQTEGSSDTDIVELNYDSIDINASKGSSVYQ